MPADPSTAPEVRAPDWLGPLGLAGDPALAALLAGERSYACVHMGTREMTLGALLDLLRDPHAPQAPRTGHLGDWSDIAHGRAGGLDFNQAICASGYGTPMVHALTRTEAGDGESRTGDWTYLPGSRVEGGRRTPLRLLTWDGRRFAERSRALPLFCPLTLAATSEGPRPLTTLHRERARDLPGLPWRLEAELLVERATEVVAMLAAMLRAGSEQPDPRRALADVTSSVAHLDGTIERCDPEPDGEAYRMGPDRYESAEALAEALLLAFRVAASPEAFFAAIDEAPPRLPILAGVALTAVTGVLTAEVDRAGPALHLHWGARHMAGYPPHRRGYLSERSTSRSLRRLLGALPGARPLCLVLLPASIFMLCPGSAWPRDAELLAELFGSAAPGGEETATREWRRRRGSRLSSYFLARFAGTERPICSASSQPVEPDGFRELTLAGACRFVAALHGATSENGKRHWS